ncbi:MAG: hypothetical protein K2K57_07030 [Oscillospiraceae bacterium]|nr:hypothetical protein [Oscillospiraceae bacterium]
MKKKSKNECTIEILYEPYKLEENESFSVIFERYMDSSDKTTEINGVVFYHALKILDLKIRGHFLLIALDNRLNLRINDTVIDELGNEYIVKGVEMPHFSGEFPEWHTYISFVNLDGSPDNMGKYFTKKLAE